MYEYKLSNIRVIDGDTIEATLDLGFKVYIRRTIRLVNVDAWEMRGPNKEKGKKAKAYLKSLIKNSNFYCLVSHKDKKGKYGRILGTLWLDNNGALRNANEIMEYNFGKTGG